MLFARSSISTSSLKRTQHISIKFGVQSLHQSYHVDFVLVYTRADISRLGLFLKHHISEIHLFPLSGKGGPEPRGPFERTLSEEPAASIYRVEQSSTPKMVAAESFETSVPFYQTIWHHIQEDGNLRSFLVNENVKHVTYTCLTL